MIAMKLGSSLRLAAGVLPLALVLLSGCAADGGEANPNLTFFRGARLIDGEGGDPIDESVIVVEAGRITQIGTATTIQVPEGSTSVDLRGKVLMPAIINAHMHPAAGSREELVRDLEHDAYWGVGAVVSLGTDSSTHSLQVTDEVLPNAARLKTAWRGITRPEEGRTTVPFWVNTEEEARAAVREIAAKGADVVKIWVDDRNNQYPKMTPALYGAAIDEAHKNNLKATAHLYALQDAKDLLRAGVDAFAHSIRDKEVDAEFLALLKEHPNLVQIPNLGDPGVAADMSWLSETLPPDRVAEIQEGAVDRPPAQQETFRIQASNLKRLSDEGIRVAFGTDGANTWSAHTEMADMVRAGLTPAQVIVAATKNAAEWAGFADMGTIAVGKSADFVVLDASPLDDITNTRKISAVYLRGVAVDRAAIAAKLKAPPATAMAR
jgi:imidazolonepropionase-like amidohydrolase